MWSKIAEEMYPDILDSIQREIENGKNRANNPIAQFLKLIRLISG